MREYVISVDLGGTQLRVALVSADGKMVARHAEPSRAQEGLETLFRRIVEGVRLIGDKAGWDRVSAVGLSVPGPVDPRRGMILYAPNLPGWYDVPLAEWLGQAVGRPVFLGNDANLAALAEQRYGAGQGQADLVYLTVSTGIGGGIISDGRMIIGRGGLGAEVGHITVQADGPLCNCGNCGCLESLASGTALARQARQLVTAGVATRIGALVGGDVSRISARVVHDAADEGDVVAIDLYRKAGMYLGVGLVNLMYLFNPGVFVIGGGVAKGWDLLYPSMQATIRQRIKEVYWRHCPIVQAVLGDDVSLIGAAALAHDSVQ